jgi:membrane protein
MSITSMLKFPWKKFFAGLYFKVLETDIFSRSAQVAFYFSFSLFPLLFFLVSLFGLVLESTDGLRLELFTYLRQIMPRTAFDLVRRTVEEIIESSSGGKLTLGLAITLWSASAGIDSLRNALNAVYQLRETRWWWRTKLESLGLTLVLILLTAVVLGIVFYGWQLFQYGLAGLGFEVTSPLLLTSIQWITTLLVMLFACEVIYNLLPNFEKFRWTWITPGSIVAIILWLILTSGFQLYLEYFNSYNKAYGSLGAVIILMLWLYLTAIVVMIGGAINSVLGELKKSQDQAEYESGFPKEKLEEPD